MLESKNEVHFLDFSNIQLGYKVLGNSGINFMELGTATASIKPYTCMAKGKGQELYFFMNVPNRGSSWYVWDPLENNFVKVQAPGSKQGKPVVDRVKPWFACALISEHFLTGNFPKRRIDPQQTATPTPETTTQRDPLQDYTNQTGVNIKPDFTLLKELQNRSFVDCASECTDSPLGCNAFEYNSTESKCKLYSLALGGFGTQGSDAIYIATGNSL
jgi:hypothetical protein